MVICLIEYAIDPSTQRAISKEEEAWFNAGRILDELYRNSQWSDLVNGYYELVRFAQDNHFFRSVPN